nr:hypothetical protein BaRGS_020346 [Batillaria attramentaria]
MNFTVFFLLGLNTTRPTTTPNTPSGNITQDPSTRYTSLFPVNTTYSNNCPSDVICLNGFCPAGAISCVCDRGWAGFKCDQKCPDDSHHASSHHHDPNHHHHHYHDDDDDDDYDYDYHCATVEFSVGSKSGIPPKSWVESTVGSEAGAFFNVDDDDENENEDDGLRSDYSG